MDTPPTIFSQSQNRKAAARAKPRTPLQERTQSRTNEDSARLGRDAGREPQDVDMFSATPFPTKPQHILLPSTVRKQKSFRDAENQMPNLLLPNQRGGYSRPSTSGQSETTMDESKERRAPVVQLKRSVSTLRDMYEAQAERSRPSTAASSAQRPGTAGSRLRSASSSEGLSGRNAWEELHKISADDMALLPTLSRSSIERLAAENSFASRAAQQNFLTSTPNYRTYGTSSPRFPVFRDDLAPSSGEYHQSSSSGTVPTSSSSPNFVRLGRSSSIDETLYTERSSSSPNFVKLGSSSPELERSSSPTPSHASDQSRKRKRTDSEVAPSFATRARPLNAAIPYAVTAASDSEPSLRSPTSVMPSSPPQPESAHSQSIGGSSPVYRLPDSTRDVSDGSSSSSSAHASLQAALSSSPMPPIQYPVIRAPAAVASTLNVPKRVVRRSSVVTESQWISRLSPVPSEWDEGPSRQGSRMSHHIDELDAASQRSDSAPPELPGNESQIRIIPVPDDDHQHEAKDELGALPRGRRPPLAFRSPPLVPERTNSLFGTSSSSSASNSQSRLNSLRTSVDTRLNSMRSFAHSRQNSYMSGSGRPGSSGSQAISFIVPTWARRYYSGLYRDSFQYLNPSQTNVQAHGSSLHLPIPVHNNFDGATSMTSNDHNHRASIANSRQSRRSWQSIRNQLRSSLVDYIPSIMTPKNRPRLEARKSHLTVGLGPLVSNPVNSEITQARVDQYRDGPTIRQISEPLPPADPRAHWAGITDEQRSIMQYNSSTPYHSSRQVNRHSGESGSVYYDAASQQMMGRSRFSDVPHLHHDRRLNTGSSASRGFGFPFNRKGRFQAPSIYDGAARPPWFRIDLRDAQVTCFIVGFLFPVSWFVGAFLPLPQRPDSFEDLEKAAYEQQRHQGSEWQEMDVVARLRLERHIKGIEELKWQNARWWKRMNRWMCLVGVVVFVLVIILAVIGTRNHW